MTTYRIDGAALFSAIVQRHRKMGIRTLTEAARVMGVHTSILYTMRTGTKVPRADTLLRVLAFLDTTDLAPFLVKVKAKKKEAA